VGRGPGLSRGLVPEIGAGGLGTLPRRPLGLGRALGLELGGRCALGICAVSLRALGPYRRPLGLGARGDCPRAGLCACTRRLHPATGDCGARTSPGRCRTARRLVSASAGRGLLARLYPQPDLYTQRQYHQRQHHQDQHDYCGAARHLRPAATDRQPAIRKPSRGNCGARAGSRRVRPGGTGSGCGSAASTSPGRCRHNTAGSATAGRDGANRSSADFSTCTAGVGACKAARSQRRRGADAAGTLDRRSVQTHSPGSDTSADPAKFLTARPSAARQPPAGGLAETPSNTAERAGDPRRSSPAVGAGSLGTSARRWCKPAGIHVQPTSGCTGFLAFGPCADRVACSAAADAGRPGHLSASCSRGTFRNPAAGIGDADSTRACANDAAGSNGRTSSGPARLLPSAAGATEASATAKLCTSDADGTSEKRHDTRGHSSADASGNRTGTDAADPPCATGCECGRGAATGAGSWSAAGDSVRNPAAGVRDAGNTRAWANDAADSGRTSSGSARLLPSAIGAAGACATAEPCTGDVRSNSEERPGTRGHSSADAGGTGTGTDAANRPCAAECEHGGGSVTGAGSWSPTACRRRSSRSATGRSTGATACGC